jgi:transcription initiation factor IIE alpha subunit
MEVEAYGSDDEGFDITTHKQIRPEDPLNLQLISVNEAVKYRRLKRFLGLSKDANIQEKGYRTVYRIRVRPPVFTLEKRGEKIVDERGFEYKALDIYVVAEKPIVFQPSSLVRVEGTPLPNPKTQQTTLLAYKVDFPEENTTFDKEKLNTLKEKFRELSVSERVCWILDNFERFSKIVGRRNLAMAGFLAYFTPLWVRFDGMLQRGWGNILFCGDTTTAKTETIRRLIMLLKAGMLITAETATAVGLTGTATQVEKEGWFVDWGFLVLLDRKLLAVDGAHKLSLSNWAALAEAERSGVVSIAKAAKNTAYARTRQIKIANPVDREADKYSTKSLSAFLYPCQAIPTILDKTSIARLDLAVFADQHDVAPEEINKVQAEEPEPELCFLAEALKWCWSSQAQIEFTMEAAKTIHDEAIGLYKTFFYDEIPLCSIDMKWKLARLSAALAFLTLSTEDYNKVTVTKEHVNWVAKFIQEEYSKAGLNILAQTERHETLTLEDVEALLLKIEGQLANVVDVETVCEVLKFFVIQGRATRDEVMAKFGLAETKQLRPLLATLTSEGLIKAKRGFYPEPKLIQAYKASEGFNFTKLTKVTKARKEPPKILGEDKHESEKNDPSFSDLGKLGNLGKMEDLGPMDNA